MQVLMFNSNSLFTFFALMQKSRKKRYTALFFLSP